MIKIDISENYGAFIFKGDYIEIDSYCDALNNLLDKDYLIRDDLHIIYKTVSDIISILKNGIEADPYKEYYSIYIPIINGLFFGFIIDDFIYHHDAYLNKVATLYDFNEKEISGDEDIAEFLSTNYDESKSLEDNVFNINEKIVVSYQEAQKCRYLVQYIDQLMFEALGRLFGPFSRVGFESELNDAKKDNPDLFKGYLFHYLEQISDIYLLSSKEEREERLLDIALILLNVDGEIYESVKEDVENTAKELNISVYDVEYVYLVDRGDENLW